MLDSSECCNKPKVAEGFSVNACDEANERFSFWIVGPNDVSGKAALYHGIAKLRVGDKVYVAWTDYWTIKGYEIETVYELTFDLALLLICSIEHEGHVGDCQVP